MDFWGSEFAIGYGLVVHHSVIVEHHAIVNLFLIIAKTTLGASKTGITTRHYNETTVIEGSVFYSGMGYNRTTIKFGADFRFGSGSK